MSPLGEMDKPDSFSDEKLPRRNGFRITVYDAASFPYKDISGRLRIG